jgi:carboxylesterase type B
VSHHTQIPPSKGFQILSSPLLGELPLIFATSNLLGRNTILENETSHYMQGAWVSFAKDPAEGLIKQYCWPRYDAAREKLIELGFEGNYSAIFAKGSAFDETCVGSI